MFVKLVEYVEFYIVAALLLLLLLCVLYVGIECLSSYCTFENMSDGNLWGQGKNCSNIAMEFHNDDSSYFVGDNDDDDIDDDDSVDFRTILVWVSIYFFFLNRPFI